MRKWIGYLVSEDVDSDIGVKIVFILKVNFLV